MNKTLTLATIFTLLPGGLLAHHGTTSQFDASRIVEISGVVTDLGFVNPHSYVYLDVTTESGEVVNWHCEMRASSLLKRSGWTEEMFANGTKVDIVGTMSRAEDNGCYIETIAFNGGEPIERYAQIEENQLQPETTRPLVTAWGDPYIAGDWAANQRLVGAVSGPNAAPRPPRGGRGRGPRIELSAAGEAAAAEIASASEEGVAGRLDCSPRDFFSDWTFDQPANRIEQEQDQIILRYGFMDTVRTIHMDMPEHPAALEPSWAGHSIGKWEDGVLVVDTVGFSVVSNRRGTHSEKFHAVERFTLDSESGTLVRTYVGEDPLFWNPGQQQTGEDTVYLADYPYEPYACDDRTVE